MVLDVKCALLYREMRRRVYIELPRQDRRYGDGSVVGMLRKAMYGTRDAPKIWRDQVQEALEELGFITSVLHPSVYFCRERGLVIIVHVDDFLCSGEASELEWLFENLRRKYEMSRTMIGEGFEQEGKYLNRLIRWTRQGIEF